jgi:hypothetical protein
LPDASTRRWAAVSGRHDHEKYAQITGTSSFHRDAGLFDGPAGQRLAALMGAGGRCKATRHVVNEPGGTSPHASPGQVLAHAAAQRLSSRRVRPGGRFRGVAHRL